MKKGSKIWYYDWTGKAIPGIVLSVDSSGFWRYDIFKIKVFPERRAPKILNVSIIQIEKRK